MIIILCVLLLLYGMAIIALSATLFGFGFGKTLGSGANSNGGGDNITSVSIVIPFRNEESNMSRLLESIEKQTYKGAMEVILINDQSEDNWESIVNKYCQLDNHIPIKIIDLQLSKNVKLTSKQQALDFGVAHSSYPLIAFTDADMVLAPNWIETLVNSKISTNANLVFGHTSIIQTNDTVDGSVDVAVDVRADKGMGFNGKKSLFAIFESYQLEYLFAFAYTFSKLNLTGSCMGNNILIDKESYLKCDGQRGIGYSIVEDRALLRMFKQKGLKIAATDPFFVTAQTYPSRSKRQFYNQMTRWAVGGLRPGGGLFLAGILLSVQNFLLFLSPFLMYRQQELSNMALLSVSNFLITWLFLAASFKKIGSKASNLLFPVYYIFIMVETIILGISLLFKPKIRWKDRKLFCR